MENGQAPVGARSGPGKWFSRSLLRHWRNKLLFIPPLLLLSILVLLVLTWRGTTTYAFYLSTEELAFSTRGTQVNAWPVDSVRVRDDSGSDKVFSGRIAVLDSVDVAVTRIGNGTLHIDLQAQNTRRSVGWYVTRGDSLSPAPEHVLVTVDDMAARGASGRSIVLPFQGTLSTPDSPDQEMDPEIPVLRSGDVVLLTESIFGSVYPAATHSLAIGDQIEIGDAASLTTGVLVANEEPGLLASYRVISESVSIIRPVAGTYRLSATMLQRLGGDPALQAAWWVVAFLWVAGAWLFSTFYPRKENR